jgi:glycosyltransferase involved in cell wall biosynthesis
MMIDTDGVMTARESRFDRLMILFLHNRYRTAGGEERVLEDLRWLVGEYLGEPTELLQRDSAETSNARAAIGLLRGGIRPEEVAAKLTSSGARVLHAHNLQPTLGWRALAGARESGARVVMHLHQYRLVCAVGVCFTQGEECLRCHGSNTLPGVVRNCRGNHAEAVSYAASLALYQRRLIEQVDAFIVPSVFARERLRSLGAPLPWERVHVLAPPIRALAGHPSDRELVRQGGGGYALVASRLAREKGVDVAIEACRLADIPLVVAGDGPELEVLRGLASRADVSFLGRIDEAELAALRERAAIALVPSLSGETFGMAAAEAIAAGVPVAGSDVGALSEIIDPQGLAQAGDADALAGAIARVREDPAGGARAPARVRGLCDPRRVASSLSAIYAGAEPVSSHGCQ